MGSQEARRAETRDKTRENIHGLLRSSLHSTRKKREEEIRPNKREDQEKMWTQNDLQRKEEENKG